MEFKNLQDGDYTLEVLVQDEVGNKSDTFTKNFKIGSSENISKILSMSFSFIFHYWLLFNQRVSEEKRGRKFGRRMGEISSGKRPIFIIPSTPSQNPSHSN